MQRAQRNGALGVARRTDPVRCAIYARKSTTEGLDSEFSSIDNQREAAEAFVTSQKHEGWSPLSERYDDGGFSGGNVERPALKRLMADVEAGLVDTIVVYKLDRLSRSLVDFGRIHEFLEKRGVALVSVTESINTKSPHGRMMVNVLLSFAQYERELVGERTRDKIHGARRRGRWTGGFPILGYDTAPEGGKLLVNTDEADRVRAVYDLFIEDPSLVRVAEELNRRGCRRKTWTTREGKNREGGPWTRLNLRMVLTNPLYAGMQKLGDDTFVGEHSAIVSKATFKRVQQLLDENQRDHVVPDRNRHGALLRGLVYCSACGAAMLHAPTTKGGKLFRYYRCGSVVRKGAGACSTKPVAAEAIESFVVSEIKRIGADPVLQAETFRQAMAQVAAERRGVKAEAKRIEKEIAAARHDVERLVATLSRTTGPVGDAVRAELEKAQESVGTLTARLREVQAREAVLAAQHVDEADVARALQDFDELWSVLLTPERERVLRLLIERVSYDGATRRLEITFAPAGIATLAAEVGATS